MPPFFLRPATALATTVLLLPFAASGACGSSTACFRYSNDLFVVNGDRCPAQADALPNFSDPNCPGPVVAVNGPGTYDGELCCYPVTYADITPACGSSSTGMGGAFTMDVGVGVGPPPPGSEVAGGGGSNPGCSQTCDNAIFFGATPCFGAPLDAYLALQACSGCGDGGTSGGGGGSGGAGGDAGSGGSAGAGGSADAGASCAAVCPFFCGNAGANPQCTACLQSACPAQLMTCTQL
jgi:hypothetical protein